MKNYTLPLSSILFLFFSLNTYAQQSDFQNPFTKGKKMIGGGITFQDSNSESIPSDSTVFSRDSFSKGFGISPYLGFFIKENIVFGINAHYSNSNLGTESDDLYYGYSTTRKTNNYGVGVFLTRYFTIKNRFGLSLSPSINFNRSNSEQIGNSYNLNPFDLISSNLDDSKGSSISVNLNAGLYYAISNKFIIETKLLGLSAGYSEGNTTRKNINGDTIYTTDNKNNSINLNFINTISFDEVFTINYIF